MRRAPLWAVLFVCGCGTGGPLSGSLSELFSLQVSNVQVQRNPEAFQVTYLHNQTAAVDVVAQVAVALTGIGFLPGATVDLSGEYAPGHPRCSVVHHADGEPERALPGVKKGTLTLSSGGQPLQGTSGSFTLSFVDDGSYGSGRTLSGTFDGVAADAGF